MAESKDKLTYLAYYQIILFHLSQNEADFSLASNIEPKRMFGCSFP